MIRMLNSYTFEFDDLELALSELSGQLDLGSRLLKNSVGIISCYSDCIETGLVEAIANRFPFDIVGITTLGSSTAGVCGTMILSLSVLTSDDVEFSAVMSESHNEEGLTESIRRAYERASDAHEGKPALILPFIPLLKNVGGEKLLYALEEASGGDVPVFGTIACDHFEDYRTQSVIFNEKASDDCTAMILVYGDVEPRFFVGNISDEKVQKQKAIITESEECILKKVNDMPLIDYMKTLGLAKGDGIEGMSTIPFLVGYNDGTKPVGRAIFLLTPEGYAVCGGTMAENATLAVGSLDFEDVVVTAKRTVKEALASGPVNGMLMFSCIGRGLILGADILAELEAVSGILANKAPYSICYSGGEYCPAYEDGGKLSNRFHNYSYVAWTF